MKKNFLILLVAGYINAQEGKIGINTQNPQATLHISLSKNADEKSNQGIIIPQLDKQRVSDISQNLLLDGTMVYINSFNNISNTDATVLRRVSQITTKDFYKYNAERDLWERMSNKRLTKNITSDYRLSEADHNYYIYANSAGFIRITVPDDLGDGFSCIIIQQGNTNGGVIINGNKVVGANGLRTKSKHSAIGIVVKDGQATITGDTAN